MESISSASQPAEQSMTHVTYELRDAVAHITIDDGKVNAMSSAVLKALHAAFACAERDKVIVLLSGRPGIFSAGFDLKVLMGTDAEAIHTMLSLGAELAVRVLTFPFPVVVACTGHAFPMGAFLMLAADVRVGADGPFKIGLNEVAIGISVPAFGVELARQRLLPAWLHRTTLTGEMFSPADAVTAGFLDRVVPPEVLRSTVDQIAQSLTTINLDGHAATKRRLRGPAAQAIRAAIDAEIVPEAHRERATRRTMRSV
jgi:enoyl-CoA hydratase